MPISETDMTKINKRWINGTRHEYYETPQRQTDHVPCLCLTANGLVKKWSLFPLKTYSYLYTCIQFQILLLLILISLFTGRKNGDTPAHLVNENVPTAPKSIPDILWDVASERVWPAKQTTSVQTECILFKDDVRIRE